MKFERIPPVSESEDIFSKERVESLAMSSEAFGERRESEGFPVQALTGRVDMTDSRFRILRGERQWKKDIETIQKREEEYKRPLLDLRGADVDERLGRSEGEQLELLTALVLEKFFSHRFVVLRSSPHDDIHYGVDTILLDKESGEVVCAFDEVEDVSKRCRDKEEKALATNIHKGGARLDYGFRKDEHGAFVPASVEHVPLFYLATSERGLREIGASVLEDPPSRRERMFFQYFLQTMLREARALREVIASKMRLGGASLRGERSRALWNIMKRTEIFEHALEAAWEREFGGKEEKAVA